MIISRIINTINNTNYQERMILFFPKNIVIGKKTYSFLNILNKYGFINNYYFQENTEGVCLRCSVRYDLSGKRALSKIYLFNASMKAVSITRDQLKTLAYRDNSFYVITTSNGLLSITEAIRRGIGGKLYCKII